MRMLIAEDDSSVGKFLMHRLTEDGHDVRLATDGEMAIEAARLDPPDLAVLDLNLPRCDGMKVLEFLRSLTEEMPILILSARQEPQTRLRCLEMGADDFMLKPFSFAELRARCRALTRRRSPGLVLRHEDLEVNRVERTVMRRGKPVSLTNREFSLLEYLLMNRGRAVSRADLMEQVWNMKSDAATNIVDVYINYLRRKLGDFSAGQHPDGEPAPCGRLIQTVRGSGYSIGLTA